MARACSGGRLSPSQRPGYRPLVDFYDWTFALHLLAAFSVAASLVLFSVLVVAGRRAQTLDEMRPIFRLGRLGGPLIGAGMVIALVLGVVLAIDSDEYELWDLWVLAGIVLWLLLLLAGLRTGNYYTDVQRLAESGEPGAETEVSARLRATTGSRWHLATIAVFVLLVLDMILKPGA